MKNISTTSDKFFEKEININDKIFIKAINNRVIGFLKIGKRHLFLSDDKGELVDLDVLSVIDFYIHHSSQREGHGKHLFDRFLNFYKVFPYQIAYDSPNTKLINFLFKYYSLKDIIKQSNSYIIYKEFFIGREKRKNGIDYNYVLNHQVTNNIRYPNLSNSVLYNNIFNNSYDLNKEKSIIINKNNFQISAEDIIK